MKFFSFKKGFIGLSRRERIQLKLWISLLGILLLIFLALGRLAIMKGTSPGQDAPEGGEENIHTPRLQKLSNVWLIEVGEDNLLLYRDGVEESYDFGTLEDGSLYQPDWGYREQVADVLLADDRVILVEPHTEKLHGVILSADENSVEVQGYGHLPLSENYRGYRVYNTLSMCTYKDMAFGYDFADLVLKDGEICSILMVREETMEDIRVLVKTTDFADVLHQELRFTCDTDFHILYGTNGEQEELHKAGEELLVDRNSDYFSGERIVIRPTALTGKIQLKNVARSQGAPGYRGQIELIAEQDGFAVVNEVSLEEYLYSVVPSEMPASYGMEALKAQAVCARTYAYGHMQHAAYPVYGAHVDDSTAYQVYNNITEQNSTTQAVKETHGQLLCLTDGTPAETYYYSTSCGVGSDARVWKTEAAQNITYIQPRAINEEAMQRTLQDGGEAAGGVTDGENVEQDEGVGQMDTDLGQYLRTEEHFAEFITHTNASDFEAGESWYRWTYTVKELSAERMSEVLKARYKANSKLVLTKGKKGYVSQQPKDFTEITNLYIGERGAGGVADELILETDSGTYKVISEHNIRYVLCDGETKVDLANGKSVQMPNLLPSGYFIIQTTTGKKSGNVIGYSLTGGGFGHGVGMSQNAARHMADRGYTCKDILLFFYTDCEVRAVY